VPAPGVAEQVGLIDPDPVHDCDRVGHMRLHIKGALRRGGGQAALLVSGDGVAVLQFGGQRLGVVGDARSAVEKKHV
jgi:hypothetical protein